jgi:hypothetical protein
VVKECVFAPGLPVRIFLSSQSHGRILQIQHTAPPASPTFTDWSRSASLPVTAQRTPSNSVNFKFQFPAILLFLLNPVFGKRLVSIESQEVGITQPIHGVQMES